MSAHLASAQTLLPAHLASAQTMLPAHLASAQVLPPAHLASAQVPLPAHLASAQDLLRAYLASAHDLYIPKLAELRKPLQVKLKKEYVWEWKQSDTDYIKKIKKNLTNFPKLYLPKEEDFLIIETDASNDFWGGVLKAKTSENEEICKYTSGSFKQAERNYHSNEKELLAVKNTISKFSIYLNPVQFLVRTDNKNFTYFLRTKISVDNKQGRLVRWQMWFSRYSFKIEHLEGTKNVLADCLTRDFQNTKHKNLEMEELKALRLKEKILLIELKNLREKIAIYDESLETTVNSVQETERLQTESIPQQMAKGKEKSNPLIPVALEKSKINEESQSSSSPEANGSGKGISNPLIADSLLKTEQVSLRPSYSQIIQEPMKYGKSKFYVIFDGEHRGIYEDWSIVSRRIRKEGNTPKGADTKLVSLTFIAGLTKFIYPSPNLLEISLFPEGVKKAIKNFRKKIAAVRDADIFIKCNSTLLDWYQGSSFQSYHHLEIGIAKARTVSPSKIMEENYEDPENWVDIRVRGFLKILENLQKIKVGSFNKVNHCSHNCIITSYSGTPLPRHEKDALERMEQSIMFNKVEAGPTIKEKLCQKLQHTYENHNCDYCTNNTKKSDSPYSDSYSTEDINNEDTRELDPTHGFIN
ncbi:hypothetical protein L1987_37865 [Smallanthus sonchifolius]|uniref:Uncharacterized protein n=1 Tax=Smallanthus sonchifolius TaxID=185202 RepID=A0ACB9HI91_9ASTR|nr:hypothetical protein L1987_37865 [Smallanthus sonchifolius]